MTRSLTPDYYELLGVPRDADAQVITHAYRRLARSSHPDTGGNSGMFRLLRAAYETLTDPERRRAYDSTLDGAYHADEAMRSADPPPRSTATTNPSEDGQGPSQWTFADGTARSLPFDPPALSWWDQVEPGAECRVLPPYARGRWPALVAALIYLCLSAAMIAIRPWGAVATVFGAALLTASYRHASGRSDHSTAIPITAAGAFCVTAVYAYVGPYLLAPLLAGLSLLALLVATVLAHRYGSAVFLDKQADREAIAAVEYGEPGVGRRTDADRTGGRIGGDALWLLTALPGVRVFHELGVPGERASTVDHAVLCGHRLALVDSRYWEPGRYAWTPYGALLRDGRHFPGGDVTIADAVTAYAAMLGDTVQVRGYLLVAPRGPGTVSCDGDGAAAYVNDPLAVVDGIGEWLLASGESNVIDRRLLLQLYRLRSANE